MVVVEALKDILSIKIKSRHDGYSDQFNRLLMTKVLLICSIIIAVEYFSDKVNCIKAEKSALKDDYIHEVCWINGFYIFKELEYSDKFQHSSYFGIPKAIQDDGLDEHDNLCSTKNMFRNFNRCTQMTKVYYLQYQYMPFYIAALSVFYYVPYLVFRMVNTDIISLRMTLKNYQGDIDKLVRTYFNYSVNSQSQLRVKIWWNLFVKSLYMCASMISFYLTDFLLMGKYITYGSKYIVYAMTSNLTTRHVKISERKHIQPGNFLLPSMGFCDIHEAVQDTRTTFHNENRVICEISPHILYQYVLMVLWFFFIASITISVIGLVSYVTGHTYYLLYYSKASASKSIHSHLTLREIEYLHFIKNKNLIMYGEVTRKLNENRKELQGKPMSALTMETNNNVDKRNSAPMMYKNGQIFSRSESYIMQPFDPNFGEEKQAFIRMQSNC